MILGFTGTSHGMAPRQRKTVHQLLYDVNTIHLGDCVGADAEAYAEAVMLGIKVVGHPPSDGKKRAFCDYDEEWAPQPYLIRNRDIVGAGIDGLIAAPKDYVQPANLRGQGTWSTIGYARLVGRHIWIVFPNGTIKEDNP